MPGALVQRVELSKAVQAPGSALMVGPSDRSSARALDLTRPIVHSTVHIGQSKARPQTSC